LEEVRRIRMKEESRLLTVEQAAHFLGLSPWTIRYWISQGKFEVVRLGRRSLLDRKYLEKVVEEATVKKRLPKK